MDKRALQAWILPMFLAVALARCNPGYCSIDEDPERCTIPTDSLCSIYEHCSGNGQCFVKASGGQFCNCTEDRRGDHCEFIYRSNASFVCSSDRDCGYSPRGTCGPLGKCLCNAGFRGDSCELVTRVIEDSQCENRGIAYKQGYQRSCFCRCGFTSSNCAIISFPALSHTSCRSKICNDKGYCISDESGVCFCDSGSNNKYCLDVIPGITTPTPLNVSTSVPLIPCTNTGATACQNGGICAQTDLTSKVDEMQCICPPDYEGQFCETAVDSPNLSEVCNSKRKCLNGGLCGSTPSGKRCFCDCGYFGSVCEYSLNPERFDFRDQCVVEGRSCLNGGSCNVTSSTGNCELTCTCPPHFTGERCETRLLTTTKRSGCQQILTNQCAYYVCREGQVCVTDTCGLPYCTAGSDSNGRFPPYMAATIALSLASLIVLVGGIMYRVRKRRKPSMTAQTAPRVSYIHSSVVYDGSGRGQRTAGPSVHLQLTVTAFDQLPSYEQAITSTDSPPSYVELYKDCDTTNNTQTTTRQNMSL